MLKKLSFRDSGAELVASSIYFSSIASRTMQDIVKNFPGYNDPRSTNHRLAVEHMLKALMPLVEKAAIGHDVDKMEIVEKLERMLSDGMS